MNILKVAQAVFTIIMLTALWRLEKKDLAQARSVLANAFVWTIGFAMPFGLIEFLSAFGVHLFDVSWALTPLDFMSAASMIALLVMSGKKLFGVISPEY